MHLIRDLQGEMAEKMAHSNGKSVPFVDAQAYDRQLEQAMQLYQERLYKAVYQCLKSHDPVEDILQLTWIKLNNYLVKSGRLPAHLDALYPWLWVVARHLMIDYQNKQRNLKSLSITEGWLMEPHIREFEHPDTVVMRCEIREAVLQALSSLPQKQRNACTLYFFYGLRLRDIAVQLQCNLNTIKSYLYRDGVPILKKVLKEQGIQLEDMNFWTGHKESTLEQYRSGVYCSSSYKVALTQPR